MFKKILIFLIVILIALGAIVFWNEKNNLCAGLGKTIGSKGMPKVCCSGLNLMAGWEGGYQGDCKLPPPGGLAVCSDCGNGACDLGNGENKCNCPEDCVGSIESSSCVKEGEKIFGEAPEKQECCAGLKVISPLDENGDRLFYDIAYCAKCGDGKCKNPENKYNCAEDCK